MSRRPPLEAPPENMRERVAYAEHSYAMALDLYDLIFPPWRWRRWWLLRREVKRRNAALRAANTRTRTELGRA